MKPAWIRHFPRQINIFTRMSELGPPRGSFAAFAAPTTVLFAALIAALAWMLPVNLKSVGPALLRAAGAGTPTLGAYGRDLVDVEKIGPAAMMLEAARARQCPRTVRHPPARPHGLGRVGSFFDPLFKLREDKGRRVSTPVLSFLIRSGPAALCAPT